MTTDATPSDSEIPAGSLAAWRSTTADVLADRVAAEVPCGDCTACCRSSQFVHIGPDETDTLAYIPAELLFPAPGRPPGHVVLGYDELGRCPMLADEGCSIYAHRPRTCRMFDCRVFAATGVDPEGPGQHPIGERARRWRFDISRDADRHARDAVRAAVVFLRDRNAGAARMHGTQLAVLAVVASEAFLPTGSDEVTVGEPDGAVVDALLSEWRVNEKGR